MFHGRTRRNTIMLTGGLAALALTFASGQAALAAPHVHQTGATQSILSADVATPTTGLNYVALGDSYSAGYGLTPITNQPVTGCDQAAANYPHQLATALGLNLTDVTCSGAVTANIIDTPQVTADGTAPVQSDALSASTDIVTVTIGGNDLGFTSIAETCAATSPDGPTILTALDTPSTANCKSIYYPDGGTDSLAAKIQNTVAPAISNTLAHIRDKAPNAKIFVVGYPALAPNQSSGCFTTPYTYPDFNTNSYPFTDVDVPYLYSVESTLNSAIQADVAAAGDTFVPIFDQTSGLTPCAGNPNSIINGITLSLAPPGIPFTFKGFTVYLKYGALHPNATGVSFMKDAVASAIQGAIQPPAITSGNPPDGVTAAPYSFAVTATGFPAPTFTVSSGALPDGLQLNTTTGQISGTPTAAGSSTFTITATNSAGSVESPLYRVAVNEAPAITSGNPPAGITGVPYTFTVTASGSPESRFTLSSGTLPDGLQLNEMTGQINGTPTTATPSTFTITATNAVGAAASPSYTVDVTAGVAAHITSGAPTAATIGAAYSFRVTATGVPAPTFSVRSGALPNGLKLDATTGAITGTPTKAGSFSFTIAAENVVGSPAVAPYTMTVHAAVTPAIPLIANLARTGSDLLPAGALAALFALAGTGILLLRRRAARR